MIMFFYSPELPSVSLLQKTPSSPVSCHATGFYPHRAVMFWRKDGEDLHEDVDQGEILPNNDETFQMRNIHSFFNGSQQLFSKARRTCLIPAVRIFHSNTTRLSTTETKGSLQFKQGKEVILNRITLGHITLMWPNITHHKCPIWTRSYNLWRMAPVEAAIS
uniref:Ig-like domain-containing protein n=1 Tax=Seriola lalandi dorsalis TaxID=1841481 RepID=A0A3B4X7Q8_SERLL